MLRCWSRYARAGRCGTGSWVERTCSRALKEGRIGCAGPPWAMKLVLPVLLKSAVADLGGRGVRLTQEQLGG